MSTPLSPLTLARSGTTPSVSPLPLLLSAIRLSLNRLLGGKDQVSCVGLGAVLTLVFLWARRALRFVRRFGLRQPALQLMVQVLRKIPGVRERIEGDLNKMIDTLDDAVVIDLPSPELRFLALPEKGMDNTELSTILRDRSARDKDRWKLGGISGCVYSGSDELTQIQGEALTLFSLSNLLHPEVFPSARNMEAEVIAMVSQMFKGEDIGCVTSGGTESLLLAMKAYRDWGRYERGITRPNVVLPITAHAAFTKAEQYFNIEMRKVPILPHNGEVDFAAVSRAVDSNTVCLVGSAPNFPHGTMDPLEQLAGLASSRGINMHVDACLGGFILPFVADQLPYKFDFSVPGVTSISCDTHKYGYACKGTSVLLYRSAALRKHQYSLCSDWPGGVYGTPTLCGSRPAAAVAATWATLVSIGRQGYQAHAEKTVATARAIARGIQDIPELEILGRPDVSVVAFGCSAASQMNVFDVYEELRRGSKKQWDLNKLQKPAGLHIAVTALSAGCDQEFLADLKAAVAALRGKESGQSEAAVVYGAATQVPRNLCEEVVSAFIDSCYRAYTAREAKEGLPQRIRAGEFRGGKEGGETRKE